MKYKDPNHKVHVIEPEFAHMLPDGCVPITDAEAEALRPVPQAASPLAQIRAIEAQPEVVDAMARASRQLLLKTWFDRVKAMPGAVAFTNAQVEAYCRANDKTYKALAEAEDAIKPLRALV